MTQKTLDDTNYHHARTVEYNEEKLSVPILDRFYNRHYKATVLIAIDIDTINIGLVMCVSMCHKPYVLYTVKTEEIKLQHNYKLCVCVCCLLYTSQNIQT